MVYLQEVYRRAFWNSLNQYFFGGGDPQVVTIAQKTTEDVAISVYQSRKDRLVSVPVGTTWMT